MKLEMDMGGFLHVVLVKYHLLLPQRRCQLQDGALDIRVLTREAIPSPRNQDSTVFASPATSRNILGRQRKNLPPGAVRNVRFVNSKQNSSHKYAGRVERHDGAPRVTAKRSTRMLTQKHVLNA